MEPSKLRIINTLFDNFAEFRPRGFSEYNDVLCEALGNAADELGIARVVYRFNRPKDSQFDFRIPDSVLLFESLSQADDEPIVFSRPYVRSGTIDFLFYPVKSGAAREENERLMKPVFELCYCILNSFLLEALYQRLTTADLFTGIPNLAAFLGFCGMLIAQGRIGGYTAFNFNIRNFKSIHQSLTYLEGNKVMETYCCIVANAVTENEIVARLGGDNFVALVLDENKDYFLDLVSNMVVRFKKEERMLSFPFGATVGAAKLSDEKNPGEIMMKITTAYQAARENRAMLSYYDNKINLHMIERKIILSKFFEAIASREFRVVYQPKVGAKDKLLRGAEALVRWYRQDGGVVMPGSFIPVLEKDGCICTLDFYVLEEVCKFQKKLITMQLEPVKISVNFSKRHLSNNKLVEEIVEVIDRYRVPHKFIEIELTESEDFHNNGVMKDIVDDLNAFGIKTSIDDFGTGYSSFGMLRTLQLDTLKIDRSFIPVSKNDNEEKSLLMLSGVVSLAKSLGLTTVAEGVETTEQLALLESLDCDIIQGYIFDKPLPEEEFLSRLRQRQYNVEEKK